MGMCNFDNMEDVDAADLCRYGRRAQLRPADDNDAGCPVRRGAGSRQQEDK